MNTQPSIQSVPKPLPDLKEIERACKIIIGTGRGRVVEVRALNTPEKTWSGYYSDASLAQDVFDLSARESTPNIYWTLHNIKRESIQPGNVLQSGVKTTTADDQVDTYLYLPIDCDPNRPAGTSATNIEKAYAHDVASGIRDFLEQRDIESILGDSGNGYHDLIRINLAVTPDTVALIKSLLNAFNAKFGTAEVAIDTAVYNPSRILKIYGSVARKGQHTNERPWRTSKLIEVPENVTVVSEEKLRALLAELVQGLPLQEQVEITQKKKYERPAVGTKIDENRNNACRDFAFDLWRNNVISKEEFKQRVYEFNETFCLPPLEQDELDKTVIPSTLKHPHRAEEVLFNGQMSGAVPSVNSTIKESEQPAPVTVVESPKPFVMVDGDSFMLEKIAPRKVLLRTKTKREPIFFAKSINQIFAWRGNGKTCLGLGLTMAFAKAGSFLNFEVLEKANVLYIEGELPEEQMQERWRQIIGKTEGRARLITLDKQPEHLFPSFASEIGMARVEETLKQCEADGFKVEVLFLDSISTLFNIAANDEENWIKIQSWLISLRSRGICIFFFHHAGKSGMSRSHSKSEDMLDVSIKLDTPAEKEEGCLHALLVFDKARNGINEPGAEIKMRPAHSADCLCRSGTGHSLVVGCRGDSVTWEHQVSIDLKKAQAFEVFASGDAGTIRTMAKDLDVPRSTLGRWRKEWGTENPPKPAVKLDRI
jgi:AAA domain